ncbi:MAG TPA: pentapeptide repeat-containing protein [Chloroflexia bacterium]
MWRRKRAFARRDTRPLGALPRFRLLGRKVWGLLGAHTNPFQTISVIIGMGTLVWGISQYLWTKEENDALQRQQAHYIAWQVVNSAQGRVVSGGRLDALEYLAHDGVSLADLSAPKANLDAVDLAGGYLVNADFTGAQMRWANLDGAILSAASFREADLVRSSFRDAKLGAGSFPLDRPGVDLSLWGGYGPADCENSAMMFVDLSNAGISQVNFTNASLSGALLIGTQARHANFNGASLRSAILEGADLSYATLLGANLTDANLDNTNLEGADIQGADFTAALNISKEQIEKAKHWEVAHFSDAMQKQLGITAPMPTRTANPFGEPRPTLTPAP